MSRPFTTKEMQNANVQNPLAILFFTGPLRMSSLAFTNFQSDNLSLTFSSPAGSNFWPFPLRELYAILNWPLIIHIPMLVTSKNHFFESRSYSSYYILFILLIIQSMIFDWLIFCFIGSEVEEWNVTELLRLFKGIV